MNVKRFDGNTALHIACGRGNVGMVALLMAGGADPNIENDDVVDILECVEPMETVNEPKGDESKETVSATSDEKDKDTVEEGEGVDTVDAVRIDQMEETNEEGETTDRRPKRGLVPADYADNNDKVISLS